MVLSVFSYLRNGYGQEKWILFKSDNKVKTYLKGNV